MVGPAMSNQLHMSLWCWIYAEMTLSMILLIFPLTVFPLPEAQELDFLVLNTCVEQEQRKPLSARNPFALVNCDMRMLCTYRVGSDGTDYCAKRNKTNLTVVKAGKTNEAEESQIDNHLVILDKGKCNLTVEFRNMTKDLQGKYLCMDTESQLFYDRNIDIGEAPVQPRNLTIMYQPQERVTLYLDPVRNGSDLNDPKTEWDVIYKWLKLTNCSRSSKHEKCKQLTEDGLCQPCSFKLGKIRGSGMYNGQGFIGAPLEFNVKVNNKFGQANATGKFCVTNWVWPGPVRNVQVTDRGPSWLMLNITPPEYIDKAHIEDMGEGEYPLAVEVYVQLTSEGNVSLLNAENKAFFDQHKFVRNLKDNNAALVQSNKSGFYLLFQKKWTDENKSNSLDMHVNISGLPFPGYLYGISVRSYARYPGETFLLNSHSAETAPMEGPELHDSFALCDVSFPSSQECVTCIIYFKEIPTVRRGGRVVNYTLSLTLLNVNSFAPKTALCRDEETFVVVVGGQNNTFVVPNLVAHGVYNLSLQAFTAAGLSPVTSRTLLVNPSPSIITPRDIVMERHDKSYDLSWKPGRYDGDEKLTHFAHYCYTLRLDNTIFPAEHLNCVANMVVQKVQDNILHSSFDNVRSYGGLTLAFFLSAVMANGSSSGLQRVEYFYKRDTVPEWESLKFSVQRSDSDPFSLKVTISLPYGRDLNYLYGRPEDYALRYYEDDGNCERTCRLKQNTEAVFTSGKIGTRFREVVEYIKDLQPDKTYCIGVNVKNHIVDQYPDKGWSCRVATTGIADYSTRWNWWVILAVALVPALVLIVIILVLLKCAKYYKRQKAKYLKNLGGHQLPLVKESSSQSVFSVMNGSVQGRENHMWKNDTGENWTSVIVGNLESPGESPIVLNWDSQRNLFSDGLAREMSEDDEIEEECDEDEDEGERSQYENRTGDRGSSLEESQTSNCSVTDVFQGDEESEEDTGDDVCDVETPLFSRYNRAGLKQVEKMFLDCLPPVPSAEHGNSFGDTDGVLAEDLTDRSMTEDSQDSADRDGDTLHSSYCDEKEPDESLAADVECDNAKEEPSIGRLDQMLQPFPQSASGQHADRVSDNCHSDLLLEDILSAAGKASLFSGPRSQLSCAQSIPPVEAHLPTECGDLDMDHILRAFQKSAGQNLPEASSAQEPAWISVSGDCFDIKNETAHVTDGDVCQDAEQENEMITLEPPIELPFSIGDILHAAKTLQPPASDNCHRDNSIPSAVKDTDQHKGGMEIPLDVILQAAEGCPWKFHLGNQMAHSAAGVPPRVSVQELQCASDFESGFETDVDTDSPGTENSHPLCNPTQRVMHSHEM